MEVIRPQTEKSDEARELAEQAGFTFVHGKCMHDEYRDLRK